MKKKYDDYSKCYLLLFIYFIIFVFIIIFLFNKKLIMYKVFDGVIFNENNILLVINDDDLKLFNRNKKLFIKNKSYKFNISKIDSNVLERNGDKYNNVFIEINMSNMYKVGDMVRISVMEDKDRLFKIFKVVWDGD